MLQQRFPEDCAPVPPPKKPTNGARSPAEAQQAHVEVVRPTYTFDEVMEASLAYFGGDELAANVFATKYALKRGQDQYVEKTPEDMHRRLAREFARIEQKYPNSLSEEDIFNLFDRFRYVVPQGSPMSAIGNPYKYQSASNCFVVPPPYDSYGGIFVTDQQQAQIMKRRGGVGFDISTLRPKGESTTNAAETTDGVGVFMERYSRTCKEVAQGGRRGALMITCDVHHPEIMTFVRIKNEKSACKACGYEERTKVTHANVSVRLSDEFLTAVEKGKTYQVRWPCDEKKNPQIEAQIDAREVWKEIMKGARESAEPGLLFWDAILRESPADCYADEGYRTVSTNPCAEIPLSANADSCRLLALNLTSFVSNPFTKDAVFEWETFHEVANKAQRLMDDLVDIELELVEKILYKIDKDPEPDWVKAPERALWEATHEAGITGRRTGLGITGLGDTIAMLGVRYGTDESIELVREIYKALAVASYEASIEMAGERGCFPIYNYAKERGHPFIERVMEAGGPELRKAWEHNGRRNIANLTTAPTGSVSMMTQTTSGIEPLFKAMYTRSKKINPSDQGARVDRTDSEGIQWQDYTVSEHGFRKWKEVTGKTDDDFEESPYYMAEAETVDWRQRVRLQAAAGEYVDHAISSTLNLPEDVTVEEVEEIYTEAWKAGCKGVTIYREGSREDAPIKKKSAFVQHSAPKRLEKLRCDIHRSRVKVGDDEYTDWMILVGLYDGKPYEIFGGYSENIEIPKKITEGVIVKRTFKDGGKYDLWYGDEDDPNKIKNIVEMFDNPQQGDFTRILSLSLRHGAPVQFIVEQLGRTANADMYDFAKVIARVLKRYIADGTEVKAVKVCPDCGGENTMVYQENCPRCRQCGSTKCG